MNEDQARTLTLSDRLPDLPKTPKNEQVVMQGGIDQRLDVRMARAGLEFSARAQGLSRVTSIVNDFHIAGVRISETGLQPQKGFELELPLPIFDFGDAAQTGSQARYMTSLPFTCAQ